MEQIIKNQPDWDDTINNNFSKFSHSEFSDNVIYLNGAKKDANLPLYYRYYNVGEFTIYTVQGYIGIPDLAAGQQIDVFNIPAITQKVRYLNVQTMDPSDTKALLDREEAPNGTFFVLNRSSNPIKDWYPRYSMLIICDND